MDVRLPYAVNTGDCVTVNFDPASSADYCLISPKSQETINGQESYRQTVKGQTTCFVVIAAGKWIVLNEHVPASPWGFSYELYDGDSGVYGGRFSVFEEGMGDPWVATLIYDEPADIGRLYAIKGMGTHSVEIQAGSGGTIADVTDTLLARGHDPACVLYLATIDPVPTWYLFSGGFVSAGPIF